jgi:integrase
MAIPTVQRRSQAADRKRPLPLSEPKLDEFDQGWALWLKEKESEGRAPKTMRNFKWGKDWIDEFRHDPVNRITSPRGFSSSQRTDFASWLRGSGLAPAAVEKILNTHLIQFLRWCASDQREETYAWRITSPKADYRTVVDDRPNRDSHPKMNETEMRLALSLARTDRDRFLLMFLACTGLRIGELGAARSGQEANLKVGALELNQNSPGKWELKVWALKPPRTERRVPVDPRVKRLWDWYIRTVRTSAPVGTDPSTGEPWQALFLTERATGPIDKDTGKRTVIPMTVSAMQDMMKEIQHNVKQPIPRLHPHVLRHTFGRAMAHVVTPWPLAAMMGHTDIRTTQIYAGLEGAEGVGFDYHSQMEFQWLDEEAAKLQPSRGKKKTRAAIPERPLPAADQSE